MRESEWTLKKDFHKLSFSFLKQVCLTNLSLEQMRQYEFKAFKENHETSKLYSYNL